MQQFPDLSAGSSRRNQLSLGLTVALAVSLFLNEYRKAEARTQQLATMQQNMDGQSSVAQENQAFWGLVGLFGKTMDANMEQMGKEIDADQAEFDRRFEIEQHERQEEKYRQEREN